ncbi:MAG: hypothetical protein MUC43_16445 [Pirellula sp.]|nr:hypothetical protein [Pirellula sp.]
MKRRKAKQTTSRLLPLVPSLHLRPVTRQRCFEGRLNSIKESIACERIRIPDSQYQPAVRAKGSQYQPAAQAWDSTPVNAPEALAPPAPQSP